MRRRLPLAPVLLLVHVALAAEAAAQVTTYLGRPIADVTLEEEGRTLTDPLLVGLMETRIGEPLSMARVRDTLDHLLGLGRYQDVRVIARMHAAGVSLTYELAPLHTVQRVEFAGDPGVPEGELRQVMIERVGALPPVSRLPEAVRAFQEVLRERGYRAARIVPHVEVQHAPEQTLVTFRITAGARTTIARAVVENATPEERADIVARARLQAGQPYDRRAIDRRLEEWAGAMRARGFYEARATQSARFSADQRTAEVTVSVERGPHVTVTFSGDPIPQEVREALVPVRREGSVEQDLLEDAEQGLRDYLQRQGYRDAQVAYTREERGDELTIAFVIRRGPRFNVAQLEIDGNASVSAADLRPLLRLEPGDPFVPSVLDTAVAGIVELYRSRGFTSATVQPSLAVVPVAGNPSRRDVAVKLAIAEGVRTLVDAVRFEGNAAIDDATLRGVLESRIGGPFYAAQVGTDRDNLQLLYLNRGYQGARVDAVPAFSSDRTKVELTFAISEGPLVRVDHVLIVGNRRTSSETIARELLLKPGQPLGYADLLESQRRLSALGLFRRVRITELRHGSDPNRDILVSVEEAPATTFGWGGGVEGGTRLRPNAQGGAEERIEFAPRGFFEVGRRNLWGKNRSVNLYSRVSLRPRDSSTADILQGASPRGGYGFNEYRIVGTFREPKILGSGADTIVTGSLEQAVRSSFDFARRIARADVARRLTPTLRAIGQYQFSHVRLFNERFGDTEDDRLLIDRLFPQVRLSTFSSTLIRDSRDDALDPDSGTLATIEIDLAARSVGSEVGFAKTTMQGFYFHRLPFPRRIVLAVGARLGLANGFPRQAPRRDRDGNPVIGAEGRQLMEVVEDLPASERFFAGGDTTVRGFALDRLGTPRTIGASGFPTGGNGLMIYNAEVRMSLFGPLGAVAFFDTGNVYEKATDLSLRELRKAAGLGLRYRSPVGPIRLDLGFKLDRREITAGNLERLTVLHISLGQAF